MKQHSMVFLLLGFAFFIRVIPLHQSYWLDESINVTAAWTRSYENLITTYAIGDFHPPLYHLLLKSWMQFFGPHEVSTRMLSVLFGVATLFYTFLIADFIWAKKRIGFFTYKIRLSYLVSFFLATSSLHIYYSGESRMYSLAALGVTMAIYYLLKTNSSLKLKEITTFQHFYLKPLEMYKSASHLLLLVSILLFLLSDYVPWLLWPLFWIVSPWISTLALLLTAPWWPFFYKQLQVGLGVASDYPLWGQVVGGFSLKNILLIPVKFLIGRTSIDNNGMYAAVIIPLLILCFWVFLSAIEGLRRKKKAVHFIPILWLFFPLLIGILLSLKISLLSYFRFLFVLPAFYILFGQGLTKLSKPLRSAIIVLILVTNSISTTAYITQKQFQREDWRAFSAWVDQQDQPSALTVIPSVAQAAPYEFYQKNIPITDSLEDLENLPQSIYLVRYVQEIFDPGDALRKEIEDLNYKLIEQKDFNGVVVWSYQLSPKLFAAL